MVSKTYNTLSLFDNFNQLTPYSVGFERQFNRLNDYVKHQQQSTGFPPYNIQKVEDFKYTIEMALAGFSKDDIEIEVADGVLTCLLYTSPSPRDRQKSRMPSSA